MLRDRFGRQFKPGQRVIVQDSGLMEGKVVKVREIAITEDGGSPQQEIVIEMSFKLPAIKPMINVGNIAIVDESGAMNLTSKHAV